MSSLPSASPVLRTRPVGVGHWRAFLCVARHLNFRAAAEELALTQSAVSRQIQALEDEVGIALFLAAFYQVGFVFSEALGRYGYLPPMLAAWAPNLVFVGLGALLFLSLDS